MGLLAGIGAVGSAAAALAGIVKGFSHSGVQKATWGDYRKQAYFDELAEGRALANAKDLFGYQEMGGPGLRVQGYKNAGINPVLAGDFSGGVPSAPTPSASSAPHEYVNNASSIIQAGSVFASLAEAMSRVRVNDANAQAIASRTNIENRLLEGRLALQQADLATKSKLPGYYQSQSDRLRSEIAINQIRRTLIDSQISLNNAREVSLFNQDWLNAERFNFDKEYKDKYLKMIDKSYIGNANVGRLYFSTIGRAFDNFSKMFGGMFQRGRLPGDVWNSELP